MLAQLAEDDLFAQALPHRFEGLAVNQLLVADRGGKDVGLEQKALGELDQGGAIGYGVDVAVFELVEQFT